MHPRNIFKQPPDYTELAIKYPDFRKVCRLVSETEFDEIFPFSNFPFPFLLFKNYFLSF